MEAMIYQHSTGQTRPPATLQAMHKLWILLAYFWFVPYTLLAIYLAFWSIKKTTASVHNTYMQAPQMMMWFTPAFYIAIFAVSVVIRPELFGIGLIILMLAIPISIPASFAFGYSFVGVSLVLYSIFQLLGIIKDHWDSQD
jgi:hypothetical protein